MKVLKVTLTVLALLALGMTTYSCKGEAKAKDKTTEEVKQGKEYTSAYICPMHCDGSGSEKPGDCPVCVGWLMKRIKSIKLMDTIMKDIIINFENLKMS